MKNLRLLLLLLFVNLANAQDNSNLFPVFPNCESQDVKQTETCFYNQLQDFVFNNFQVPRDLITQQYKGTVKLLFEVDTTGTFQVQYVDAMYPELIAESKRIFGMLPKIKPATFQGRAVYSKYTIRIEIPLQSRDSLSSLSQQSKTKSASGFHNRNKELKEFDSIVSQKFDHPIYDSHLNIPFSHSLYAQFDAAMNQVGANNHTASKPYTYAEVAQYYDLKAANDKLMKPTTGWWGRKFWNENFFQFQGKDYWITLNPMVDLRLGKATPSDISYTYQNTRALQLQAGLGKNLVLTSTIYESQGRFADYYNQYATSIRPSGGNPAIIPGIGIAKQFKTDAFDFPSADANITYTPSTAINLQLGYGRNFLGDGYRSLLLSDGASPSPFFKINTSFWKIKYTNSYMWLKDVRPEATVDGTYGSKFMANHYLSLNLTKRWNIGIFESVVWTNSNDRGFDMNFVNPIVFYRTVEFNSSSKSGNAVLGLTTKYKFNNQVNFYGQFILDEFSLNSIKDQNKSWQNKYGYQLGVKYYNAFAIDNLLLQAEYNHVRPYVYSHSDPITNYGHNNQSLGHQWGGNFREFIAMARYNKGRYFADAKLTYGIRGFDFDTAEDGFNYGGNIYKNYEIDRPFDTGVAIGQGNKTSVVIADLNAGYLVNPTTNLKFFVNFLYRSFNPETETANTLQSSTSWLTVGIRSDIFNMYFDY